ncbi:DUF7507 domain-containing protein, partial [Flavobacterium aquicola]|uniref:DUF7507 domain-containing protein n=1 Tax=Flavobacterium aquicola TaxID=1682742 RepID=UPI001B865FD3
VKTNSASGCTATASVTITVDNSPITVSAGNPFTKTCTTNTAGASIGETAVTGNTYSWTSVPAGFSSAEANPIVNPDQTTIYTVVKTNSASGCTATANVIVTVDNSPITVSAGNPFTKTCTTNTAGASIGETAVTGNTYSWTSVPAGFTSGDANPTVNPEQTTVYTVVKTNIASGCTATANVTVTVDNSSITVSAGNSFTKTCTANTAGASIGETAEIGNTYSWTSIPAGFTSTEANPIVNPDQTTIYTVIKTNSTSGCTATASVTVTVDNSPITVSTENSFTKTCTANTAGSSIGETAVTGNTYSWTSVPAGFTSTEANPIVNPDQTTVYTVVKTNSASGCTATASVTITVDNSPITVSAGNPFTKTCITNIAGASIGETAVKENTYSWTSVPVGFTSTEANPMVNPDQTTIYTVFKTNSTSGCTATASVTVKMDTAIPTLTISNPLVVCSPATVDITSNKIQTTNNGTTTKYYTTLELANLGGVSDLTTPSAINSSGIYYIRSEFTNGCFIVKPVEVSINACSIALVKQSELHNTGNCTAVGDKITYTFTITNPGTTPISNITITDPLLASPNPNVPILYVSGDTDSDDSLNSSETWTYKADYSVNQSDINVGKIINQAAVNGMVLGTNNISSLSGTDISNHNPTITELCQSPSIKITKDGNYVDSNQDGITNVGDIVSYNFVIENTGNVPLTNITVTDNNAVITTGSITTLAVGAIDTNTFSGSHAITQDDINIGYVYNLAIVTAKDPNDNPVTDTSSDPTPCTTCPIDPKCPDCTITPLTQSPGLIVIKTAVTESYSKVGDIINYSIIVKNTGNQTLHQIIVKDPLTGLNTTIAILEPNASSEYSQSYLVTQNDLDKGSVTNVATADGLTPNGTPISASDDEIVKEKTNQIDAVDDSAGPIDGINGAVNVLNVFNNDTLNAIAVNPADVKLTLVTPDAAGFMTMNTDGSIDLKDGTPAGIYTLVYQICENADLGNCDTAAVTITVICNNTAKISGHVLNLGTNTPLANVPVTLIPQKNTTGPILIRITDARGYYNFTGMIPGDYLVQVQDANLNSAYGLYPVNSSLFFTALESCKYQSHDFGYDKSDLPVLGDFVWYDVNNNGIQDEWFDANNDNLVTKNIPNQDGSFDYSKWEWIDLNGDGSYTGTLNVGELNAAGFGNAKSENIFVTGPNSYSDKVIIGIQGFWRNRPDAGAYGDYTVELKMDANLEAQASAMGATGLVKVLPSDSKKTRLSKIAKPASVEICGLTNENPQTAVVTAVDPVHLDLDFGISCKMFANIQAVDDVYNVTQCSIADEIRNAVTNDLLDGLPASISAFKFKLLTSLPQDIDISIDETGSISFLNGVAAGQYIFDYEVCEAINPANCATATITINVAPIEPITIAGPAACNGDTTPVDLSKFLPEGTPTTGTWNDSDNTRGLVGNILSTAGIPISTYKFEYKLEGECPRSIFLNVEINDDCTPLACKAIIIHNAVSANEDNKNDYFEIENLESNDCYKNFKVEIFNRWGVLVFERENYNNDANAFRGRSEGRTTINKNEGLPTGTYFYIVSYDTVDGVGKTLSIKKDGYLYLVNK